MPSIILQGKKIEYQIKKNRLSRRLSLSVKRDGTLMATVPYFFSQASLIERFIKEKADWILQQKKKMEEQGQQNIKFDHKDYLVNKERARALVEEKIALFNKLYKFKIGKISIRNQQTRWGSCSGRGNLNFSYKLVFLPGYVADYIIVHELCHLKELNHSARFWALVAKTIPNYLVIRRELKSHGLKLL